MKAASGNALVRRAQDERIILTGYGDGKPSTAATGPRDRYPPPATPDTFGQATDPRAARRDLTAAALVRQAEKAAAKALWTSTGRLSPGRAGRLRPVCRYIGP